MWEGSVQPHAFWQRTEGALSGCPDHTEGLPVLQGPEEKSLGATEVLRAAQPDRERGTAGRGEGGRCYSELLPSLQAG